jgi:hypothetical protein
MVALNLSSKWPYCWTFPFLIALSDFFRQYLFWQEVAAERVLARVWEERQQGPDVLLRAVPVVLWAC